MNTTPPDRSLAEVIDLVEQAERVRRGEDAGRLKLLAAALAQVQATASNQSPVLVGGRTIAGTRDLAYRSLRAELAAALTLSEYAIDRELALADTLQTRYPATLAELEAGTIAKAHAQVLADEGTLIGVGDEAAIVQRRAAYEASVLEAARVSTPRQLTPIARRLAEVWADTTIEQRHQEARTRRSVTVVDVGDGMADLLAHLPLVEAVAIHDRLTQIARSVERGERLVRSAEERAQIIEQHTSGAGDTDTNGDNDSIGSNDSTDGTDGTDGIERVNGIEDDCSVPSGASVLGRGDLRCSESVCGSARTRDQVRADALTELLLESDVFELVAGSPAEAIQARIQLIAPAELVNRVGSGTENDSSDGDGDSDGDDNSFLVELAGYGPIPAGTARNLAANASHWEDTRVHPDTGMVLSVDRYRPSAEMRRLLGARDQRCRFPSCRVPVHRCDFDHTIDAAQGGPTATSNLAALCKSHHMLKHHTDWQVEQLAAGVLHWVSPAGRHHTTVPPDLRPLKRQPVSPPARSERHRTLSQGIAPPTSGDNSGKSGGSSDSCGSGGSIADTGSSAEDRRKAEGRALRKSNVRFEPAHPF